METFMTILFVLSVTLIILAGAAVVSVLAIMYDSKRVESDEIWIILVCVAVGLGGYIAGVNIDDYQAQMKIEQFKNICILEDSEGRFDANNGSAVFKIDGDIELMMIGSDWRVRLDDEMLDVLHLPKCKKK